ncbi:insulin-like growth factor binding proteinn-terminal [Anaeramoeba flamelloides]|uniref:Insulin-like growth factor binding proteinn-terminal n=1 Tax=Anaeramoeba flamelloides TaxID=1746091 RepID=A0AAV7YYZ5_9EUKA|nr:insulin-like growth factor binding proteinn-terminal [Anaeramoeba flamelloides]
MRWVGICPALYNIEKETEEIYDFEFIPSPSICVISRPIANAQVRERVRLREGKSALSSIREMTVFSMWIAKGEGGGEILRGRLYHENFEGKTKEIQISDKEYESINTANVTKINEEYFLVVYSCKSEGDVGFKIMVVVHDVNGVIVLKNKQVNNYETPADHLYPSAVGFEEDKFALSWTMFAHNGNRSIKFSILNLEGDFLIGDQIREIDLPGIDKPLGSRVIYLETEDTFMVTFPAMSGINYDVYSTRIDNNDNYDQGPLFKVSLESSDQPQKSCRVAQLTDEQIIVGWTNQNSSNKYHIIKIQMMYTNGTHILPEIALRSIDDNLEIKKILALPEYEQFLVLYHQRVGADRDQNYKIYLAFFNEFGVRVRNDVELIAGSIYNYGNDLTLLTDNKLALVGSNRQKDTEHPMYRRLYGMDFPKLLKPIPAQSVDKMIYWELTLPKEEYFTNYDSTTATHLEYSAQLNDKSPLSSWIEFKQNDKVLQFCGTPPSHLKDLTIEIVVTNFCDQSLYSEFLVSFPGSDPQCSGIPESILGIDDQSFEIYQEFEFYLEKGTFLNADGSANDLKFNVSRDGGGNLPEWLFFDQHKMKFFGQADDQQKLYPITIFAVNQCGETSESVTFGLTIKMPDNCSAHSLTINKIITSRQINELFGKYYLHIPRDTCQNEDETHDQIMYHAYFDGKALPSWLDFSPLTNNFILHNTTHPQDILITLECKNKCKMIKKQDFTITINAIVLTTQNKYIKSPTVLPKVDNKNQTSHHILKAGGDEIFATWVYDSRVTYGMTMDRFASSIISDKIIIDAGGYPYTSPKADYNKDDGTFYYTYQQEMDTSEIFGQLLDSHLNQASNCLQINQDTDYMQTDPTVSYIPGKNLFIDCFASEDSKSTSDITCQKLTTSGDPIDNNFIIFPKMSDKKNNLEMLSNEEHQRVFWLTENDKTGSYQDIYLTIKDFNGFNILSNKIVNPEYAGSINRKPSMGINEKRNLMVICWESDWDKGGVFHIYCKLSDFNGEMLTDQIQIDEGGMLYGSDCSVSTAVGDEVWIIAWNSRDDPGKNAIYYKLFDSNLHPISDNIRIDLDFSSINTAPKASSFGAHNRTMFVYNHRVAQEHVYLLFTVNVFSQPILNTQQDNITLNPRSNFEFGLNNNLFVHNPNHPSEIIYDYEIIDLNLNRKTKRLNWLHFDCEKLVFSGITPSIEQAFNVTIIAYLDNGISNTQSFTLEIANTDLICPQKLNAELFDHYPNKELRFCTCCEGDDAYSLDGEYVTIANKSYLSIIPSKQVNCEKERKEMFFMNLQASIAGGLSFRNTREFVFDHNKEHFETLIYVFDHFSLSIKDHSSIYFNTRVEFTNFDIDQDPIIEIDGQSSLQFYHLQFYELKVNTATVGLINITNSNLILDSIEFLHPDQDITLLTRHNTRYYENNFVELKNCETIGRVITKNEIYYNTNHILFHNCLPSTLKTENDTIILSEGADSATNYNEFPIEHLSLYGNIKSKYRRQQVLIGDFNWLQGEIELLSIKITGTLNIQEPEVKKIINSYIVNQNRIAWFNGDLHLSSGSAISNYQKFEIFGDNDLMSIFDDNLNDGSGVNNKLTNNGVIDVFHSTGKLELEINFSNNQLINVARPIICYNSFNNADQGEIYIQESNDLADQPIFVLHSNDFLFEGALKVNYTDWTDRAINHKFTIFYLPNHNQYIKSDDHFAFTYIDTQCYLKNSNKQKYLETKFVGCRPGEYGTDLFSTCHECPVGRYSSSYSQTGCVDCGVGTYGDTVGKSKCYNCQPGSYNTGMGKTKCELCDAGYYNTKSGMTDCESCDVGTYAAAGQSLCDKCSAGTYNNQTAQSQCLECPPGYYQDEIHATFCKDCEFGTYQDGTGFAQCNGCPRGTFSNTKGQVNCVKCFRGTYNTKTGLTTCASCEIGFFNDQLGQSICEKCPYDTYQESTGNSVCNYCPANSITLSKSSTDIKDCYCKLGYYGENGKRCIKCTTGQECARIGQRYPDAESGYWINSDNPELVIKCTNAEACPGGKTSICNKELGYRGFACSECDVGFYRFEDKCQKCPDGQTERLVLLFILFVLITIVLLIISKKAKNYFGSFSIIINFCQIIAIMPGMKLNWPVSLVNFFQYFSAINLNIDYLALECNFQFTFLEKWFLIMFMPVYLIIVLIFIYFVVWLHGLLVGFFGEKFLRCLPSFCERPTRTEYSLFVYLLLELKYRFSKIFTHGYSKAELKNLINTLLNTFFAFLIIMYLILSLKILEMFNCSQNEYDQNYYLQSEPSIVCYQDYWNTKILPYVIVFSALYIIGIPIFFIWILWYHSKHCTEEIFDARLGLLCSRYHKQYFYWEIVVIVRKILVVVAGVYLSHSPTVQVIATNIIILFSLILQSEYNPYNTRPRNILEFSLLCIIEFVLIAGLIFVTDDFTNGKDERRNNLANLVIGFVFFGFALLLFVSIYEINDRIKEKKRKQKIRRKYKFNKSIVRLKQSPEIKFLNSKPSFSSLVGFLATLSNNSNRHVKDLFLYLSVFVPIYSERSKQFNQQFEETKGSYKHIWNRNFVNIFTAWYQEKSDFSQKYRILKILDSYIKYQLVEPRKVKRDRKFSKHFRKRFSTPKKK